MWALSTFRREVLNLDAGVKLVAGAVRQAGIPIIASVAGLTMDPESWLPACLAVQAAGASMIQLDLFYMPQPRCSPENVRRLLQLIGFLANRLDIPVAPKLNLDLPAHYAAEILEGSPVTAIFAIDSVRVPAPLDPRADMRSRFVHAPNAGECSLFGEWQKPITLQYAKTLAERVTYPLCVGGGLMTGTDAIEAIALGATTVQFATAIIQGGFGKIRSIISEMNQYLDSHCHADIAEVRGLALRRFIRDEHRIEFGHMKAKVNHNICIMCGRCTDQTFCSDIWVVDGRVKVLDTCDGCGMCLSVCPTKPAKSLSLVSAARGHEGEHNNATASRE
jgi:dihydroorotate dehydrogenase/Pyruvate/2-oxoacid:ferredoxin oxidoreductase delta subunit